MGQYCLVQNNVVAQGPIILPDSWANISNMSLMSDTQLQTLGWLPYTEIIPSPPDPTCSLVLSRTITTTSVTDTYTQVPLPADQALIQLQNYQSLMIDTVNNQSGTWRSQYITTIAGQDSIYLLKDNEATAYNTVVANNGTPNPSDYPIMSAEATATNTTLADLAAIVTTTANQWKQLAASSEALRRGTTVAIENATTVAQISAIYSSFLATLYPPTTTTTAAP